MPSADQTVLRAKCVVVGEPSVGKSAIVQMFSTDGVSFPTTYQFTTGVEMSVKSLTFAPLNFAIDLHVYDCGGKDIYTDVTQKHWANADMIMVVFDVTNPGSLDVAGQWLEKVKSYNSSGLSNPLTVLVGNKIDLLKRRMVSEESGEAAAIHMKFNSGYFSVSAKDFENINKPFFTLAENFKRHFDRKAISIGQICV